MGLRDTLRALTARFRNRCTPCRDGGLQHGTPAMPGDLTAPDGPHCNGAGAMPILAVAKERRSLELAMRSAGFSLNEAKRIVAIVVQWAREADTHTSEADALRSKETNHEHRHRRNRAPHR